MDEIVTSTIELALKKLQSQPPDKYVNSMINLIRKDFEKLVNSERTDQVLLFCRQMRRLLAYNDPLPFKLVFEWHEDMCCLIKELNGQQRHNQSVERFRCKMNLEEQLEKRELHFHPFFCDRKTLPELIGEQQGFFQNYRQTCLSRHSKIPIKIPQLIERELQHLEIDFDCSNQLFQLCEINLIQYNFLASVQHSDIISKKNSFETIDNLLKSNRWLVILGEAGSGKTTLLHWLTNRYSQEASTLIPIEISICNFADWLVINPTKSLIDYINYRSEHVYADHGARILKKSIDHGHALLLLDGLDEILRFEQRKQIFDLIRQFIDEYIRAPDFTSAFDYQIVRKDLTELVFQPVVETPQPNQSNGNQILMTSRSIGYTLHPIVGSFIAHYTSLSMNEKQAKEFAEKWFNAVEKSLVRTSDEESTQINKRRIQTIESMLEVIPKTFTINPWLLSLICTSVMQSMEPIVFKSQIELYDYLVQTSLSDRRPLELLHISETVFIDFLIDLAIYLHLCSPSGLIEEFDIKRICRLTFQERQGEPLFNNRTELYQYVDSVINVLDSHLGFMVQRGLQVYSFQHVAFQDYFVARGLIRGSAIENITKRILSYTINFRFHQSISLAIGRLSFHRSFDDYERFCQYLVRTADEYAIPFGILLLFDSINQMKMLPSKETLIFGLNQLFNHPSHLIVSTYFFWNLSKLSDAIIIEWMQTNLGETQSISKFCECLAERRDQKFDRGRHIPKLPLIVYQQLWSLHSHSVAIEFGIDQVLRIAMLRDNITEKIFNEDLTLHLSSTDPSPPNIHPLILAVVTAVCGGVYYTMEESILKINFSGKKMHRQSNALGPIIECLRKKRELNSHDFQSLAKQYDDTLDNRLPTDCSSDTVDTFIAWICLRGISDLSSYGKYLHYEAFALAIERFKWNWFHLMISGLCIDLGTTTNYRTSHLESETETILQTFSSQSFSSACLAALRKLRIFDKQGLPKILKFHAYQANKHPSLILLTCLPKFLQKLYTHAIDSASNTTYSLPLVVFLVDCLDQIETIVGDGPMVACALSILKPLLVAHSLENYALAIFQETYSNQMNLKDCDEFYLRSGFAWQTLIDLEHERITQSKRSKIDLRLFAALISFARILQGAHRANIPVDTRSITAKKIYFLITKISDPILRIDAFGIILHMTKPMVVDIEQKIQMREEMIGVLFSLFTALPLLTSTYLFIRCYQQRMYFPELFQDMSILLGTQFNEILPTQQVAFVALRQLHGPYLSNSLTNFSRKLTNLADLLQFNSPIIHHHLQSRSTFPSCNPSLLSMIYLNELTFDLQNVNMHGETNDEQSLSLTVRQLLDQLQQESSKFEGVLTYQTVIIITRYFRILNKNTVSSILRVIFRCVSIEKRALLVIQQWLEYKSDADLYPFAHFAALELLIAGLDRTNAMDVVNEMVSKKDSNRLISVANHLFNSPLVDVHDLRQILVALKRHNLISKMSLDITRKETLDLIFQLAFEQMNTIMYPSFLLMIKSCSIDLQICLLEYMKKESQINDSINEEFYAIVVKCSIESGLIHQLSEEFLEFLFTFLHNLNYPQIQMLIISVMEKTISHGANNKSTIPMQSAMITEFEIVINHFQEYSEDFLNVCLLCYGKLLLRLQLSQQNVKISSSIEEKLSEIYKRYSPAILAIRAAFCLQFGKGLYLKSCLTVSWFREMSNIDMTTHLTILLQATLYQINRQFYDLTEVKEHFKLYPQSMNIFVQNLYDYLDRDSHVRAPDYVYIARWILREHSEIFLTAIRNSSFEEVFKAKLHKHSEKYPNDRVNLLHIYSAFGIVTEELLDISDSLDNNDYRIDFPSNDFKQILDRCAVEKLFSILDKNRNKAVFKFLSRTLQCLVKINAISSLDVHRQLRVSTQTSSETGLQWDSSDEEIFDLLLNISSFPNVKATLHVNRSLATKRNIDAAFDEQMITIEKQLNLPCDDNRLSGSGIPSLVFIRHV